MEPQRVLRARAPEPLIAAVGAFASLTGSTPSAAMRELLVDALGRRGFWPPVEAPRAR